MTSSTDMTAQQKLVIQNYSSHITHRYAPRTVENHVCLLTMFSKGVHKEFDQVTRQDIDNYLATLAPLTAEIMKSKLRKFYTWFYKADMKHLPEVVADLECNANAYKPKKTDKDVLTTEEIERFITCLPELQHKALLETLIVTGGRNTEVRSLTLGDIEERDGVVWINLPAVKTRNRNPIRKIPIAPIAGNPCARYPKYLMQWIQSRAGEQKTNSLFISLSQSSYGKQLTSSGVEGIVRRAGKIMGKNGLHPHLLRHTGASYDGSFLTEQDLCTKYGWVIGSAMPRRYCHTNEKNLEARIRKLSGIKEDTLTHKVCSRCGERNSLNADSCIKCHEILNLEKIKQELEAKRTLENRLAEMEARMDLMNRILDERMQRGYLEKTLQIEQEAERKEKESFERGEL